MFVSYAQNFEDVMLWRALKDITGGCYIDVGAQDPVSDSVSKAFYDLGWRGIHVEPVPYFARLLREQRPEEQVFQVALGASAGTEKLYCIEGTGLSTVVEEVASRHLSENGFVFEVLSVPRLTLDMIFQTLPPGRDVHWLKIDVEGAELAVLDGWSRRKYRPWIVVIEATRPGSTTENFDEWEDRLTSNHYSHVYSDGLNRYYLAAEHYAALSPSFIYPPNVFDGVSLSGLAHSPWTTLVEKRAAETARDLQSSLEAERVATKHRVADLQDSIEALRMVHTAELESVQQALSRASEEHTVLERSLRQDLQVANEESVRWSSLVAARERSHGEVLGEHFSKFQRSLQSTMDRAESLAQQAADEQRERQALMQHVARLGAQLEALESELARERETFSIRERDSLRRAAEHAAEVTAFIVDTERLSRALDTANGQVSQLRQSLVASSDEYEHRVALARAEHDQANAEVARMKHALAESESRFVSVVEPVRAENALLTETVTTLRANHAQELTAVRRVAEESNVRLQHMDQQVQALRHDLRQQDMAVIYWTNIAAKHEWSANGMRSSWSWRLTAPLRWAGAVVFRIAASVRAFPANTVAVVEKFPSGLLEHAVRWIRRHPVQQRWLLSWLNRTPGLRSRMLEFAAAVPLPSPTQPHAAALQSSLSLSLERSLAQGVAPIPVPAPVQAAASGPMFSNNDSAPSLVAINVDEFSRALKSWQLGRRVNT